jgi:hypothetical protein
MAMLRPKFVRHLHHAAAAEFKVWDRSFILLRRLAQKIGAMG